MLTFPLALSVLNDIIPVGRAKFRLMNNQELSGMGSGQILAAELAPSLWTAEVSTPQYPHDKIDQVQARLEALDGSIRSFYLADPKRLYPQYDPNGTKLAGFTPTINSINANMRAISLGGLPGLYAITVGDLLCFDYGSPARRSFHRVVESATAGNSSGITAQFEIRPLVRTGTTTGLTVTLIKPAFKCILKPDSVESERLDTNFSQLSFSVIQRL